MVRVAQSSLEGLGVPWGTQTFPWEFGMWSFAVFSAWKKGKS